MDGRWANKVARSMGIMIIRYEECFLNKVNLLNWSERKKMVVLKLYTY